MDWMQMIERVGIPLGILGAVAWGLWHTASYLAHRLFHEESGLVTRVAEKHIGFVEKATDRMDRLAHSQDRIEAKVDTLLASTQKGEPI